MVVVQSSTSYQVKHGRPELWQYIILQGSKAVGTFPWSLPGPHILFRHGIDRARPSFRTTFNRLSIHSRRLKSVVLRPSSRREGASLRSRQGCNNSSINTWVGVGFPLGSVAIILPLGYAFGLFELKILYLASIILFEAGSALCGGAPTMDALIVGRVIAGAGGAGMYLGCLNYIGAFTTLRERNLYNSLAGIVW
jgi:MFS family permease